MDEFSTTTATLDQAEEEEILTYTASDEALEAAAGTGREIETVVSHPWCIRPGGC
jgi:predicted house-cleaning NTP pyrophosphatase (Maf/HAM1 superfamily)